jgi:hypothetical protein
VACRATPTRHSQRTETSSLPWLNFAQVNKDASSLSQNATDLSSLEISYFKALVRVSHGIPFGHLGRQLIGLDGMHRSKTS